MEFDDIVNAIKSRFLPFRDGEIASNELGNLPSIAGKYSRLPEHGANRSCDCSSFGVRWRYCQNRLTGPERVRVFGGHRVGPHFVGKLFDPAEIAVEYIEAFDRFRFAQEGYRFPIPTRLSSDRSNRGRFESAQALQQCKRRTPFDGMMLAFIAAEHDPSFELGGNAKDRVERFQSEKTGFVDPEYALACRFLQTLIEEKPGDRVGRGEALLAKYTATRFGRRGEYEYGFPLTLDRINAGANERRLSATGDTPNQDHPIGRFQDMADDRPLFE